MGKWGVFIVECAFTMLVAGLITIIARVAFDAEGVWLVALSVLVAVPAGKGIAEAVVRGYDKRANKSRG